MSVTGVYGFCEEGVEISVEFADIDVDPEVITERVVATVVPASDCVTDDMESTHQTGRRSSQFWWVRVILPLTSTLAAIQWMFDSEDEKSLKFNFKNISMARIEVND